MSDIYKREGNIDKTIEYLSLGREMFEEDQSLINTEINLYIELGRTSELITKLGEAIELDSVIVYYILIEEQFMTRRRVTKSGK